MAVLIPAVRLGAVFICNLFVLLLVAVPAPGMAETCFSDSPSKRAGEPVTAEVDISNLTTSQYKDLKTLFTSLQGNWQGTVQETVCGGTINAVKKKVHAYKVEPEISFERSQTFKLESTWRSPDRKTSRIENMELILKQDRLRLNVDAAAGEVKLIKAADNFLVFLDKNNFRNQAGGVVSQENVRSLAYTPHSLTIEYRLYTNGRLVSFSVWDLSRKR
ncbi:MAG: hypothetical protein PVJ39_01905 [Gammaproteobacteria bacterium]